MTEPHPIGAAHALCGIALRRVAVHPRPLVAVVGPKEAELVAGTGEILSHYQSYHPVAVLALPIIRAQEVEFGFGVTSLAALIASMSIQVSRSLSNYHPDDIMKGLDYAFEHIDTLLLSLAQPLPPDTLTLPVAANFISSRRPATPPPPREKTVLEGRKEKRRGVNLGGDLEVPEDVAWFFEESEDEKKGERTSPLKEQKGAKDKKMEKSSVEKREEEKEVQRLGDERETRGWRATLVNLRSAQGVKLNGRIGTIIGFDAKKDRYQVKISKRPPQAGLRMLMPDPVCLTGYQIRYIKKQNLERIPTVDCEALARLLARGRCDEEIVLASARVATALSEAHGTMGKESMDLRDWDDSRLDFHLRIGPSRPVEVIEGAIIDLPSPAPALIGLYARPRESRVLLVSDSLQDSPGDLPEISESVEVVETRRRDVEVRLRENVSKLVRLGVSVVLCVGSIGKMTRGQLRQQQILGIENVSYGEMVSACGLLQVPLLPGGCEVCPRHLGTCQAHARKLGRLHTLSGTSNYSLIIKNLTHSDIDIDRTAQRNPEGKYRTLRRKTSTAVVNIVICSPSDAQTRRREQSLRALLRRLRVVSRAVISGNPGGILLPGG
ncbi:hypothetical protein AAMO2058_000935500 [Amorphochlora amoebiformis]